MDARRRSLLLRRKEGFTLVEAMVSVGLLTIFLMGVVAAQAYFGTQTSDREVRTCLLDNASNALLQFRNGIAPATTFVCKNQAGTISIAATLLPEPNPNNCMRTTATAASSSGKSMTVTTSVCDF